MAEHEDEVRELDDLSPVTDEASAGANEGPLSDITDASGKQIPVDDLAALADSAVLATADGVATEEIAEKAPEAAASAEVEEEVSGAAIRKRSSLSETLAANQNYVEWGGLAGAAFVLALLGSFAVIYFATAVYLLAMIGVFYGIWKGRETNTAYSVILGCALAALLTAVFFVWTDLDRYQFDIKARGAKPHAQATSMGEPATAKITAAV